MVNQFYTVGKVAADSGGSYCPLRAAPAPLECHFSLYREIQMTFVCVPFSVLFMLGLYQFHRKIWKHYNFFFIFIPWNNLNVARVLSSFGKTYLSRSQPLGEKEQWCVWFVLLCFSYSISWENYGSVHFLGSLLICSQEEPQKPSLNPTATSFFFFSRLLLLLVVVVIIFRFEKFKSPYVPCIHCSPGLTSYVWFKQIMKCYY